jgi:hypothetical protein
MGLEINHVFPGPAPSDLLPPSRPHLPIML